MIDLERERALTPGCHGQAFLDSAGSSLSPRPVVDTVIAHLRREEEVGGYRAAAERSDDLVAVRASVARLIGGTTDEVALVDSATRAWIQFVSALRWRTGDRILICGNEYASNAIAFLQRARADGCSVEVVPSLPDGTPDREAFARLLDDRVRLVSLVQVPTNSGTVAPVRDLAGLARSAGALTVLDACQSVGQLSVDVADLGVDALSATGRKWLRAPRGTGFLWVRRSLLETLEPFAADMHGADWTDSEDYRLRPDATRFELFESDVAATLGLGVALDHLLDLDPAEVEASVRARAAVLREGLGALPQVALHDRGDDLAGIVSFTVAGLAPAQVESRLGETGVTVSVSGRSSTRLDMSDRGLDAVVRASPHYFVSPDDLDRTISAVAAVTGS
ncbi:aminotransferase class V-fold PLP-dependent enzyme [Nocardioides marmorisolisilvae]|uniref:Aminotransferase class V-fold PLP-dependent enzyme n=1 Tax=Nocardioides marmorisolisilvae TaxID=1542737 RepID=A0A3N0DXP0_9ACTN|nr:aminotransferase class V-fold PLP-dependent enzyme [Nocardioides marmorisolisilvae]RNL80365.1 aminotransferase class V-fold PLP-dependent enzyme [Nocardioides marmorisolisilvae]